MPLIASASSAAGSLRQEVLVDGRFGLVTDEPEALGGTDEGPTPHELLVGAMAACVATTIQVFAGRHGWALGDLRVEVSYDQSTTPRGVDVQIHTSEPLDEKVQARVLAAAKACKVRKAIEAGMVFHEALAAGS